MKRFRNLIVSALVIMLMMTLVFPFSVCANGPAPSPELTVELFNLPEGTAYVDIAVCVPEKEIVALAQDPPEGVSKNSPLVRGEYGDFFSYSFRVQHAQSLIVPDEHGRVSFLDAGKIHDWGKIRIVMADENGGILKLSDIFSLVPRNLFDYSLNMLSYDAATDRLEMETAQGPMLVLLYILMSIVGLVLTCFVEWFIGAAFRLTRAYTRLIVLTNVISQAAMRILFIPLYSLLPNYMMLTVLLEILVYAGEFIAYRFLAKNVPGYKWLLYVLAANTASVLAGLLLNLYL